MTTTRRATWLTALLVAAALMLTLIPATQADARHRGTQEFRVTITNLTDGQLMTPTVVATHSWRGGIFRPWRTASPGVQGLAENGDVPGLVDELNANRRIKSVQVAGEAPFGPGESVSVEVTSERGARFFSVAGMLICTNDGFGGIAKRWLNPYKTRTFYGQAWDAGTEINTEAFADLVPPCSGQGQSGETNPDLAENGRIKLHKGIDGIADLNPDVYDFSGAVIKVVVEPLD